MIATVSLEDIGQNYRQLARAPLSHVLKKIGRVHPAHVGALLDPKWRPWVARIVGRDEKHGLAREFLKPLRDWKDSNSSGSRGVRLIFTLHSGRIYEVRELLSWSKERRYFCEAVNGSVVELESTEVFRRIDSGSFVMQAIIGKAASL